MGIYRYPVTKQRIRGLPQKPYRNGVGAWEGVVLHFTANYDDTAESEAIYTAKSYEKAFVHEFVDPKTCIQCANPDYIAYGAGRYANERFVHIEMCHADTREEFNRAFDCWCERAAEYLFARKLGVTGARPDGTGTLWSHMDVTRYLGGTDHADPIEYLKLWGISWQQVIERVAHYYEMLEQEEKQKEIPDWKAEGYNFLVEKGILRNGHNPLEAVDLATLGVILKRWKEANR